MKPLQVLRNILTVRKLKYIKYTNILFGLSSLTTGGIFNFQSSIAVSNYYFTTNYGTVGTTAMALTTIYF